jgi:hypothetical protein
VHERHRSPDPSPSRSPWGWSKCPKEKKLRTTEWAKWPRNGTVLGCRKLPSVRVRGENFGEAGEEGRNYLHQRQLHRLLHLVMRISLGKTRK